MRAAVATRALRHARKLELGAVIHLGRGEESTGGRGKSKSSPTHGGGVAQYFCSRDRRREAFVHHLFDLYAKWPPAARDWTGRPAFRKLPP